MLQKKSAKTAHNTSLNKKDFVKKLLKDNSNIIWPKEMRMVKILLEIFPNENFWNSLELNFKLNSLCWLLSDDGRAYLNKEYKKYNLELPKAETFQIEKNNIAFENNKCYDTHKALNMREFLSLWQKKTL